MERRPLSTPLTLANVAKTVLHYLPPGASILDYGSGVGHKPAVLQCLGFDCCAVDNMQTALPADSDRVVAFASSFGVDYRRLEIGNELPLPFAEESFDMTMMHHVIEHLHESPRKLLNHLLELTKPGGYLYVTAPNAANIRKRIHLLLGKTNHPPFQDFYYRRPRWTGHVREYVRGDLTLLAEYLNLETLELKGIDDMMAVRFAGARLKKRVWLLASAAFPDWKDTWQMVARKPRGWVPDRRRVRANDEPGNHA